MEALSPIEFTQLPSPALLCLEARDAKECLSQWALDKSLLVTKYKYSTSSVSMKENDDFILRSFLKQMLDAHSLGVRKYHYTILCCTYLYSQHTLQTNTYMISLSQEI
jgi:hypothetical protein